MPVTALEYKQYIISTQINYTCDYYANYKANISGDMVERFLKSSKLKPAFIWEQVKDEIIYSSNGCLIIDKTVLEHKNTTQIENAYKQWSGNSHAIVVGIGVINLVYYNPDLDRFWIIDYRIWDKKVDGKKETEHAMTLLKQAVKREVIFTTVLFDAFYASNEILNYIGLDLKKIFYCNLNSSRTCKEEFEYKQIKDLEWTDNELQTGKLVKLRDIPIKMPIRLFSIASSDRRIDVLCTNNTTSMTALEMQQAYSLRWKVEEFHRQIKQTLGIAKCQCRKNRSQRNHIVCCMLSWIYLTKEAIKNKTTIYQLKKKQLDDYMVSVLKHPYWKYQGV